MSVIIYNVKQQNDFTTTKSTNQKLLTKQFLVIQLAAKKQPNKDKKIQVGSKYKNFILVCQGILKKIC